MHDKDNMTFTELRQKEFRVAEDFCDTRDQLTWAVGDMFYDWNRINEMEDGEELILKIHKGGTHLFPVDSIDIYKSALNPSIYFKISCEIKRRGSDEGFYKMETYNP